MYPVVIPGAEDAGKHVRCYCNLPACVTTGYMCKSPLGGCFSHLLPDLVRARHGCLETVEDRNQKATCMNSPSGSAVWAMNGGTNAGQATAVAGGSLFLCCFRDLCNHVDSPQSHLRLNDTVAGNWSGLNNALGTNLATQGLGATGTTETNPTDIWFRAATIAVPICGAVILFMLIAIAVKILRTDALDASNKLSATYLPHETRRARLEQPLMKKIVPSRDGCFVELQPAAAAPLLLSHANISHQCETAKNEAHAKINLAASMDGDVKDDNYPGMQHYSQAVPQQSSLLHKPLNTDQSARDVNVNIVPGRSEDNVAECAKGKLYDKQPLPLNDKLYNKETILHWGQGGASVNQFPR